MPQPLEPITVVSFVSLAVLGVLGLRKLVLMEGLFELRAVILTVLLWCVLFGLFVMACPPYQYDCVIVFND